MITKVKYFMNTHAKINLVDKKTVPFLICLTVLLFTTPAMAVEGLSEEEMSILSMFYEDKDLVITPTRAPKPISQVAENMTIITAKEIELMNAHTVAEALNRATGLFVDFNGQDFGSMSMLYIQGSTEQQVLVLLDGIPWNYFENATAQMNTFPVHAVERIEIIKGPASSAWGSSLGGVINIVTKPAGKTKKTKGAVSVSYGEQSSQDQNAELYGKVDAVGYYLSAGRQTSNGLRDNRYFDNYSLYSKLRINTGSNSALTLTAGYSEPRQKMGFADLDLSVEALQRFFHTTASYETDLTENIELFVLLYRLEQNLYFNGDSTVGKQKTVGGRSRLAWKHKIHTIVLGADYRRGKVEQTGTSEIDEWAVYANDTIVSGKWAVTPGIRYDYNDIGGSFTSPSLGATYRLSPDTILRLSAARGFRSPTLADTEIGGLNYDKNPDLGPERVWSYQGGVESVLAKHIKAKATVFQHDQEDRLTIIDTDGDNTMSENSGKNRRRGGEIETETVPVLNVSFKGGFAYVNSKNFTNSETSNKYTWNLGLTYDDLRSIRTEIFGHYVWWDNNSASLKGKYSDFLWDVNIIKRLTTLSGIKPELFFTAHNIFNGKQYSAYYYKNPKQWIEGGIRARF